MRHTIWPRSAADIFRSDFDGTFATFASHSELGLLPTDDIDAADIMRSGAKPPTVPGLGLVGLVSLALLVLTVGSLVIITSDARLARARAR